MLLGPRLDVPRYSSTCQCNVARDLSTLPCISGNCIRRETETSGNAPDREAKGCFPLAEVGGGHRLRFRDGNHHAMLYSRHISGLTETSETRHL
jgi:hypothetical protein